MIIDGPIRPHIVIGVRLGKIPGYHPAFEGHFIHKNVEKPDVWYHYLFLGLAAISACALTYLLLVYAPRHL